MSTRKAELRAQIFAERQKLAPSFVLAGSAAMVAKLAELQPLRKAQNIMAFAAFGNEISVDGFIEELRNQGKTVLLPRINRESGIEAVVYDNWESCSISSFGIREPLGKAVEPQSIDAILVPGIAFDGNGFRIGYGKGYYDSFLPKLSSYAFICGVCFDFQVVDSINPETYDVPVHWIVTDKSELAIDFNYF